MKTIIAGSRDITDMAILEKAIASFGGGKKITEVFSGGARGVDQLAIVWAKANGVPYSVFPADWKADGKAAGHKRNAVMAKQADALVAVWDGHSPGTKDMIDKMRKLNKLFWVFVSCIDDEEWE